MPPLTATSRSPARIAVSRMPVARTLEAQTLLIVSEETSLGMPASICAWREGIWPWPACSTWPITTCWTWSGATPARSRAALIAIPPSSVAWSEERPPPSLPTGVRAVPRITVLDMRQIRWPPAGVDSSSIRRPCNGRPRNHRAPRSHRRRHDRGRRLRGRGRRPRPARRAARRAAGVGRGAHRLPQARPDPRRRAPLDRRRARQARGVRPRARQDRRRRGARPRPRAGRAARCAGSSRTTSPTPTPPRSSTARHGRLRVHARSSPAPTRTTTAASSTS